MDMDIKKIIREEIGEWDWVRDIQPGIPLEPDKIYLFDPPLINPNFNNIIMGMFQQSDSYLYRELLTDLKMKKNVGNVSGIIYIRVSDNIGVYEVLSYDDPETEVLNAKDWIKQSYPGHDIIDVRKTYPTLFNNK